jgi:hypothetical protein
LRPEWTTRVERTIWSIAVVAAFLSGRFTAAPARDWLSGVCALVMAWCVCRLLGSMRREIRRDEAEFREMMRSMVEREEGRKR